MPRYLKLMSGPLRPGEKRKARRYTKKGLTKVEKGNEANRKECA